MNAIDPYIGVIKAAAVVVLLLGVFAFGYHSNHGAEHVQAAWDKEKAERLAADNRAVFERIRANERAAEQQDVERQQLKKGYENEIAKIRATADRAASVGLRIPASVCSGLASTAQAKSASGGNDRIAGTVELPESIARDIQAEAERADKIVASCRVAQKFIQDNGFAP